MAINDITEVMHRIRAKLYPNYLHGVNGKYIARTQAEAPLTIEDVAAAAKNRGGYTGSYEDLVEHIRIYFSEAAYQLAGGFAITNDFFSIHPKIGGTFDKPSDPIDPSKHKLDFSFRVRPRLRALASKITIEIEGVAETSGYIDEFLDIHTGSIDDALTSGGMFAVSGHKIKVEGSDPAVGVYFVSKADGSRVKVTEHLGENGVSKVIALTPALSAGAYTVEIVTQYAHGNLLKDPRVIAYPAILTVG
jgi:hypothetical protein